MRAHKFEQNPENNWIGLTGAGLVLLLFDPDKTGSIQHWLCTDSVQTYKNFLESVTKTIF